MATAIQRRRGTTEEHATFAGLAGEVTVDTTKKTLVVHDGETAGGSPLATEQFVAQAMADGELASEAAAGRLRLATQEQAEGGDEGGAYAMTPLRTSQHLAAKFSGHFDTALAAQTGAEPVANKIPLADGDGKLASGWLPAATNEQPGAVKLTSTPSATDESAAITPKGAHDTVVANAGKVSLLSTRSTEGDWTITGCTVGKPLIVLMSRGASATTYAHLHAHSGADGGTSPNPSYGFILGHTSGYAASNTFACVPTENTVTLKILHLVGGAVLRAYQ